MAPDTKLSKLLFRCKVGVARKLVGRNSAKVLAKILVGDQGVVLLNKCYEACRILVGGDQKEANDFIDRSIRILTDCAVYAIEQKFSEAEKTSFLFRTNQEIANYNRLFNLIEEFQPGFNDSQIPAVESSHQLTFKQFSQKFISNITKIFVETLGHHFDASLIHCIHEISDQLCSDHSLTQMCYTKSPLCLVCTEVAQTAYRLELSQRRLNSNLRAVQNGTQKVNGTSISQLKF